MDWICPTGMAKCFSHQMSKTFQICKWISFAILTLVIVEETLSERIMLSNLISICWSWRKLHTQLASSNTVQCTKLYNPKIVFVANWPPLQFDNWTYFATIDVLHCCLSEEEVDVILILQSIDKIRGWKLEKIRSLE